MRHSPWNLVVAGTFVTHAVAGTADPTEALDEFSQWAQGYGKEYRSYEEASERFQVWVANRDFVNKHNDKHARNLTTFRMKLNHLGDLSLSEYQGTMLGYHASARHRGTPQLYRPQAAIPSLPAQMPEVAPDAWDWRDFGVVNAVKNQGQCGSCWAFSAVAAIEGAVNWAANGTVPAVCTQKCGAHLKPCCSFSEQELVDCTANGKDTCNVGGLPADGISEIVDAMGGLMNTEDEYPYTSGGGTSSGKCHNKSAAVKTGVTGFAKVKSGDEAAAKQAVWTQPVLSIGIDASQQSFQFYSEGVYIEPACKNGADDLDHGVAIVGYGVGPAVPYKPYPDCVGNSDAPSCEAAPKCHWCADAFFCSNDPCVLTGTSGTGAGVDYWLVRNSWGSTWGMDGYIKMARNRDNQCGVVTNAISATTGTAPPSPPPAPAPSPPGPSSKYVAIGEKTCTDSKCTKCKADSFKTNTCLQTTLPSLYIIGSCSDDGSQIQENTFEDSACASKTGSYPSKTEQCLPNASGDGWTLYTCKTSSETEVLV